MASDVEHRRRSIRLKGYDYSRAGAYFITICTHARACLFGEIVDGKMRLNDAGRMVQGCWDAIPKHFPDVVTDECVVMPNHIHGIVWVGKGTACRAPTTCHVPTVEQFGKPVSGSLPTIIRSFKSAVTKRINESHGAAGAPVWQRNYYEHIIRDDESLNQIRQYIIDNPAQWAMDRENPNRENHDD